jgi:two-component system nitrogen regulation response regulator GlnG
VAASTGDEALAQLRQALPDAVILDVKMPGTDGLTVLKEVRQIDPNLPVIMITAFGEVKTAVEAVKLGAYDFLTKPFANEELLLVLRRALAEQALRREVRALHSRLEETAPLAELMGSSREITRVFEQIRCVAGTDFSVLVVGETGCGKELVARAVHRMSSRHTNDFVAVDCGSIPETLIESELFGHEEGAFTGAAHARTGQFERAGGGTLFLDEVANLPAAMQAKLLRALQERSVRRVGGAEPIPVDIRVIAATNRPLDACVRDDAFRRDLYHRLNEFTIEVPALRERPDDLIYLAKRFLDVTNEELRKNVRGFTEEALEMLLAHPWPGNVRELRNVVRRAVLLADEVIEPRHLAILGQKGGPSPDGRGTGALSGAPDVPATVELDESFSLKDIVKRRVAEVERQVIAQVLERTGGNKSQAARILKIDYKTMHYKTKRYGLGRIDPRQRPIRLANQ